MSADMWLWCPICKLDNEQKTVRVDGIYDIDVTIEGKIDIKSIQAYCKNCKKDFII